jgi:hypothetical protein
MMAGILVYGAPPAYAESEAFPKGAASSDGSVTGQITHVEDTRRIADTGAR